MMSSARRVTSLRSSIATSPSRIDSASQTAAAIGTPIDSTTMSMRSRGEIRSQKSRARSVIAMATSHALRRNGELELLERSVVLGRSARDVLEALDLLERGDQRVDLLARLHGPRHLDLLIADVELVDVERDLVLRGDLARDLEEDVVRRHLRQRRRARPTTTGAGVHGDDLVGALALEDADLL